MEEAQALRSAVKDVTDPRMELVDVTPNLQAVQRLATRLPFRVMVIDAGFSVMYDNEPARARGNVPGHLHLAKCYEAIAGRTEPCRSCPAVEAMQSGEIQTMSRAQRGAHHCLLQEAVPLVSSEGRARAALVLFGDHRVVAPSASVPTERPVTHAAENQLGRLIGRSQPMRQLFEMIRLVSGSQATVLLQGESGTGKELAAKTIHTLSGRRAMPFIVVDCGALPETLLESELFGHVKGAFTGATANKKGLLEEAHGGTVFFDEIADTSPQFQAKLLRVLQEGEIKPVGSSRSITVDVRIISATNKDLLELIKTKRFREDLYYRLAVLPLDLPALRRRRDDIPLLVQHFLQRSSTRHVKYVRTLTDEAMEALMRAPWPGNVRELEHVIERAVVMASGPALTLTDFGEGWNKAGEPTSGRDLRAVARDAAQTAERARIVEALHQASGKRARAARALKISRASLYNKLRAYHISLDSPCS